MREVLRGVAGQDEAVGFLDRAADRPHHAYLFAGPEGSGKRLAAAAFAAAILCPDGGCGRCRHCRLALGDRHPNLLVLEPEGRDIRVGGGGDDHGTARWLVARANRTAPEPGGKVFRIEQADRMTEEAADVLLKVVEEPPADTVFLLMSARPHELPETIRSRCQTVAFHPLAEAFVVETLGAEDIAGDRARLASRLAGGNVGRARRLARDDDGLAFRDEALEALREARGPGGALAAAQRLTEAAGAYKKRLVSALQEELEPLLDPDTGQVAEQFRAVARRAQDRHQRRERRAEREFLDWSLMALQTWYRDALLVAAGGDPAWVVNLDLDWTGDGVRAGEATAAIAALEEARAALADETNLNARLAVEGAFLRIAEAA